MSATNAEPGTEPSPDVLRYAAFTDTPAGGNPAGVVLDAADLDAGSMQRIAAEVGDSETVFLTAIHDRRYRARYFSPLAEVPFCGHATVASAVALGERIGPGVLHLATRAGEVAVQVTAGGDEPARAVLTSVAPRMAEVDAVALAESLAALGWDRGDLDPALPPRVAYAGAHHLVLAAGTRARLADLAYDVDRLAALMTSRGWTTVALVWRESPTLFHARNPFPVGGVVEDPATGSAAAAFGAYLRELGLLVPPAALTILQGADMGRPSRLEVELRPDESGVRVAGEAVRIPDPPRGQRGGSGGS